MPKKGSPRCDFDDGMQLAAGHADADRFIPLDDGAEIGRDQLLDIIAHIGRQVISSRASQPPRALSAPQMP